VSFEGDLTRRRFALHGQPDGLVIDARGLHHPRAANGRGQTFTPYGEITHVAASRKALWIGTRRSVFVLPRRAFVDENGPENLIRALLQRIADSPGGDAQLARMAAVEETARGAAALRAFWGLAIVCLAVFAAQLLFGPGVYEVGYYSPPLVEDGDLWRLVTANLLHGFPGFPLHLVLNMLAVVSLGFLVERPLGTARTLCVIGASGLASMFASGAAGYSAVVGASGIAFGLAGAVLWLDIRCAEELPAWWRFPRRTFYLVLAVNGALMFVFPLIAGAAHVGGFLGGVGATALVNGSRLHAGRAPRPVQVVAGAVVAMLGLSLWSAGRELVAPGDYIARHAARLAELPGVSPFELNDRAWLIAISEDASEEHMEAALRLAERAVAETNRDSPELLDTLAEVQFQLGWSHQALVTIEEAIQRAPDVTYYQEQRRRFLGERPPQDRPDSPLPWDDPAPTPSEPEDPSLTV
jgi:membrane associated rhomboid family serine protease